MVFYKGPCLIQVYTIHSIIIQLLEVRTDKNKIYDASDPTRLNSNNFLKCKT